MSRRVTSSSTSLAPSTSSRAHAASSPSINARSSSQTPHQHEEEDDDDDDDDDDDEHDDEEQHGKRGHGDDEDDEEDEQHGVGNDSSFGGGGGAGETKITNGMKKMNLTSAPSKDTTSGGKDTRSSSSKPSTSALKSTPTTGTATTIHTTNTALSSSSSGSQKAKSSALADPLSAVRRNTKGGIHVNPVELKQAFEFFDSEGKGYITIADLKKRLGVFYQNLSLREYKFLMNNKQELTESDLYQLLVCNELTNYDPVAEAFKIYDPNNTGYIDLEVFKEILANLGFGEITEQDIQTLIETADADGDGKVSLADFRKMLPTTNTDKAENSKRK